MKNSKETIMFLPGGIIILSNGDQNEKLREDMSE